jgi:sigma-B regulation protein RsbU (phosphoserine phosphatase)
LEALSDLHHLHEQSQLYTFVLNRCSDVLKAQGGTFFSAKEDADELYPEAAKGVSLSLIREIPFKMKLGLSGWVASNRKSVIVENAQNDERFNRAVDVITGVRTRSVLCVPVVHNAQLLGVVELVNRVDGVFREPDLDFLQHLSTQVAVALENCRLYRETSNLLVYTNSVINSLSGGFISTELQGNVTRVNNAACRILGVVPQDLIGKPILKGLAHYPAFAAILDVTLKHQSGVSRQEIELHRPDGSALLIGYSTFLVRGESQIHGAGILFQDLTQIRK